MNKAPRIALIPFTTMCSFHMCFFLCTLNPLWSYWGAKEDWIKARNLCRCVSFIIWPNASFGNLDSPLVIGVLGEKPLGKALERACQKEKRPIKVLLLERFEKNKDIPFCHLLFIGESQKTHLPALLKRLKGKPTVTISSIAGFIELGGSIRLSRDKDQLRWEFNLSWAREAGVQINANLLRMGKIVAY